METLILSQADHIKTAGVRLRQLIDALDMTYADAAKIMGVAKNHLGNWMRGDRSYPMVYPLYRFCRVKGVNMDWVFLGDPSALPHHVMERLLRLAAAPEDPPVLARQASETAVQSKPRVRAKA